MKQITAHLRRRINPVSYTHLDVYKRQLPKAADKQPVAAETTSAAPGAKAPTTAAAPLHETSSRESASQRQRIQVSPQFHAFQTSYTRNMISLKEDFDHIIAGEVDSACAHLLSEASSLFASKTSLELFDMIHNMRSVDDTIYAHSLNVALISRAIGKWLQLSKEDLNTLTLAALLHDIGKTQIPPEILNKQGKLTDEERCV